jgi:hypothetical protein
MGSSGKKVTVGYKYFLGAHMVLCHGPIDKITSIEVDEKEAWSGTSTGGAININSPNLFGGESREGGVSGTVDILMGETTQSRNSYLQARLGNDIPAFRGVVSAVLNQVYVGLSPYMKRWAFWGERVHVRQDGIAQWYDAKAAIGSNGDMNPAHIIRECITDPFWGMGYAEADVDDAAFTAAADQLESEGMGMSILWDRATTLEDFIALVLKHIDAVLYVDRYTGLFVLNLVRDDYVVDDLLLLDEDSIDKVTRFKRSTSDELINKVTVKFWNSSTGKTDAVTAKETALVAQYGTNATIQQFPGFTNGTLASQVASRSLKALSTPLASCVIYANRTAASLNKGDPFKMSWSPYGLTEVIMRVLDIDFGTLTDNKIKITAAQDVFGISSAVYAAPPATGWTDPNSDPVACTYHSLIEAPFWEVVQRVGETEAGSIASDAGFAIVTAVRPSDDSINAKIWSDPTDALYEEAGTVDFTPTATSSGAIGYTETVIPLLGAVDIDIVGLNTYAVWGNEIVRIDAISSSEMTVARGCLDTIPEEHSDGERVFFADVFYETDQVEYVDGETARIKVLPTTGHGTLDIGSAVEQTVVMDSRLSRPYPPGRLELNNGYYADAVPGDADIVVTGQHRDRLQQTATLIPSSEDSGIGPEAGTTYTIELRTLVGGLIDSDTGLSAPSYTLTEAAMGSNYGRLRVLMWSTRDSLDSYQTHDFEFTRAGYGTAYGYAYGGA